MKFKFILLLLLSASCVGQTTQVANYFHIANQGDTILTGPASWTGQTGGNIPTSSSWSPTFVVTTAQMPLFVQWVAPTTGMVWTNPIMGIDPYPNHSKEIGTVELSVVQTFTVQPSGTTSPNSIVTVVVPALAGAVAPPPPIITQETIQYTCVQPVAGTVIPPSLPTNGMIMVCVFGLTNLPVPPPTTN